MSDTVSIVQQVSPDQTKKIVGYATSIQNLMFSTFQIRESLQNSDREYQREKDWTDQQLRARIANRRGNSQAIQNLTVPIIMPQVESALIYLVNVFLTGNPIFSVVADPQFQDAAMQIETIIAENANTAGWAREMILFFRDGLKYNLQALEVTWSQITTYTTENDLETGVKPKEVVWKGNRLKRMDLYNSFWDTRVAPAELSERGEFFGYNTFRSRIDAIQYMQNRFGDIPDNVQLAALQSTLNTNGISANGYTAFGYFIPYINPDPMMNPDTVTTMDWDAWGNDTMAAGRSLSYGNGYVFTKIYCRIVPKDFGFDVPQNDKPQVWEFEMVNGQVVIYAQKMQNVHNRIPVLMGQSKEDGLNYQTKSFATDVSDMQYLASSMWNGLLAGMRRAVSDRMVYNPLYIDKQDINSVNPTAKIPLRPSAFMKDPKDAAHQLPFDGSAMSIFLQGSDQIGRMANLINGQNPAQQGQFVKGNKTLKEYEDTMGHGQGHNQLIALMLENSVFIPVKNIVLMNILQFQAASQITNPMTQTQVAVNPVSLREAAIQFKVSDGIIPVEKLMNSDEFMVAMQVISSSQQIGQGYNLAPLFSYIMKIGGVDLSPFEKSPEQIQFEQQMMAWQQAAALALQKGGQFDTPMPQPPASLQQQAGGQQPGAQRQQVPGGTAVRSGPTLASPSPNQSMTQQPQRAA